MRIRACANRPAMNCRAHLTSVAARRRTDSGSPRGEAPRMHLGSPPFPSAGEGAGGEVPPEIPPSTPRGPMTLPSFSSCGKTTSAAPTTDTTSLSGRNCRCATASSSAAVKSPSRSGKYSKWWSGKSCRKRASQPLHHVVAGLHRRREHPDQVILPLAQLLLPDRLAHQPPHLEKDLRHRRSGVFARHRRAHVEEAPARAATPGSCSPRR